MKVGGGFLHNLLSDDLHGGICSVNKEHQIVI